MKNIIIILLLLFSLTTKAQSLVISNNDVVTFNASSYDTDYAWGATFLGYLPCKYPGKTNFAFPISRSGEGWLGWYQDEEEKWGLPFWSSGTSQVRNFYATDDNGGYVSNNIVDYGTNIANAPQLFYNGTAVTNEGYDFPMTFYYIGNTIHDSSDGDGNGISRNAGSMWLNGHYSTPVVDEWHMLWTNGWQQDVVGNRYLGFNAGSHPKQAGYLGMSITTWKALGADTNFGYAIFDWTGVSVTTNQCAVTGLGKAGSTLSCSIKFDCMPPGFMYQPGTISNDASLVCSAMPVVCNWFQWIIRGSNFTDSATYAITIDGTTVTTCSGAILNAGTNWMYNTTGPLWGQRTNVYNAELDLYGLNHTTLQPTHNAGSTGSIPGVGDLINYKSHAAGFYDTSGQRGATYVSSMASSVSDMKKYITAIYTVAQQTNHILTITEIFNISVNNVRINNTTLK